MHDRDRARDGAASPARAGGRHAAPAVDLMQAGNRAMATVLGTRAIQRAERDELEDATPAAAAVAGPTDAGPTDAGPGSAPDPTALAPELEENE